MPDRYTYPGAEVLKNKSGIEDPHLAYALETEVAYYRLVEFSAHPIPGDFDLDHLRAMHRAVYADLWDWAGEIRTVDTGTTNTGLAHCRPQFIVEQARIVFGGIERDDFLRNMDHDTVSDRLAYHWGETTALHPFRDGNTRIQRLFFHQMTTEAGWSIDWESINAGMDQFIHARLIAHGGNHEPLRDVLAPTLRPLEAAEKATGLAGPDLAAQVAHFRSAAFRQRSSESTRSRPATPEGQATPPTSYGRQADRGPEIGE